MITAAAIPMGYPTDVESLKPSFATRMYVTDTAVINDAGIAVISEENLFLCVFIR